MKKRCESKVVISCFFICLLVPAYVCFYVCIMCVLPGVVAIKIQFNVCYLVLFVCLLASQANIQTSQANIQTTPSNTH